MYPWFQWKERREEKREGGERKEGIKFVIRISELMSIIYQLLAMTWTIQLKGIEPQLFHLQNEVTCNPEKHSIS